MGDVVVAPSVIHGLGVLAARSFLADETVLRVDDPRQVDGSHPLRPEVGESEVYCDNLEEGRVVLMLAPERHIKFSCEPNTFVKSIRGIRHVLARRPIRPGKEITDD
jgi:SET domain